MFSKEVAEVCSKIGAYYLIKNGGTDFDKAGDEIIKLHISNVELSTEGEVIISTARPGLLIGKRAKNFDDLSVYLGLKINIVEVNSIVDLLIPYPRVEYEESGYGMTGEELHRYFTQEDVQ